MMFDLDDKRHLEAAEGWLELGLHLEANEELEKITPQLRGHPDALELRWHIFAKEKKWEACVDIAEAKINVPRGSREKVIWEMSDYWSRTEGTHYQ